MLMTGGMCQTVLCTVYGESDVVNDLQTHRVLNVQYFFQASESLVFLQPDIWMLKLTN